MECDRRRCARAARQSIRSVALVPLLLLVVAAGGRAAAQDRSPADREQIRTPLVHRRFGRLQENRPYLQRLVTAFRTARNLLPPGAEDEGALAELEQAAAAAARAGRTGDARHLLYRMIYGVCGLPWSEHAAYTYSLVLDSSDLVIDPQQLGARGAIHVRLGQLYDAPPPDGARWVHWSLHRVRSDEPDRGPDLELVRSLGQPAPLPGDPVESPLIAPLVLGDLAAGAYAIVASVSGDRLLGRSLALATRWLVVEVVPGLWAQEAVVERRLPGLAASDDVLASIRYPFEHARAVNAGAREGGRYDFATGAAASAGLVDHLARGEDPFAQRRGVVARHYRLSATGEIMPYTLFLPAAYDRVHALPLVVALHGQGGNERTLMERGDGQIQQLAERHGFLVLCPLGYREDGGYGRLEPGMRDTRREQVVRNSELDVVGALERVLALYRVDSGRIYLMGHSMGGSGTWVLGSRHAERFAALAPVAAGGVRADEIDPERLRGVPVFAAHGARDATADPATSRRLVAHLQQAGGEATLFEDPEADHASIVAAALPRIFEFFAGQRRAR